VQNVACVKGDHFDHVACKCVPDAPLPMVILCQKDGDCPAGQLCVSAPPLNCPRGAACVVPKLCATPVQAVDAGPGN
jgi:hypothetical protein